MSDFGNSGSPADRKAERELEEQGFFDTLQKPDDEIPVGWGIDGEPEELTAAETLLRYLENRTPKPLTTGQAHAWILAYTNARALAQGLGRRFDTSLNTWVILRVTNSFLPSGARRS